MRLRFGWLVRWAYSWWREAWVPIKMPPPPGTVQSQEIRHPLRHRVITLSPLLAAARRSKGRSMAQNNAAKRRAYVQSMKPRP